MEGLEPPRLSAPDPKSGAATDYATSACSKLLRKYTNKSPVCPAHENGTDK